MSLIETVHARQILDSRGNPTVEAEVVLEDGTQGPRRFRQALDRRKRSGRTARRATKRVIWAKAFSNAVDNVNDKIAYEIEGLNALDRLC
jgi:enolase